GSPCCTTGGEGHRTRYRCIHSREPHHAGNCWPFRPTWSAQVSLLSCDPKVHDRSTSCRPAYRDTGDSLKRILIVDDERQIIRMLRVSLQSSGYEVFLAANGAEAFSKFKEARPDLVISDLAMPEM